MANFDENKMFPDAFETVKFEHTEELNVFLGKEYCDKYAYIYPLLWLSSYRMQTFKRYGTTDMMFNGENNATQAVLIKNCLYPLQVICNCFNRKSSKDEILLSPTVFKSDRYVPLLKLMKDNYAIVKTATACDINLYGVKDFGNYLKDNFFGRKRYFYGFGVCSSKLKNSINRWMHYCLELEKNGVSSVADNTEAAVIMDELLCEFTRLVKKAKKALSRSDIKQYITVNQYNIRDLIFITACSELGIRTKQYEHHASRVMHNVIDGKRVARYIYTDEICCWSKSEYDFHTNVYQYLNILHGRDIEFSYAGNPEILIDTAKDSLAQYPEENRITFMVSGLANVMDPEAVAKDLAFRKDIFEALKELSDRQGVKVLVRYPPGINMEYRKEEEPYLKGLGFEISPSTRETLMEDICKSFAVFGTLSSVMSLSALMGKQVYQIAQENVKYYLTDKNIHPVTVADIENIVFDRTPTALDPEDFIDFDKLFKL